MIGWLTVLVVLAWSSIALAASGPSLPTTCSVNEPHFINTSKPWTEGVCFCVAANTWGCLSKTTLQELIDAPGGNVINATKERPLDISGFRVYRDDDGETITEVVDAAGGPTNIILRPAKGKRVIVQDPNKNPIMQMGGGNITKFPPIGGAKTVCNANNEWGERRLPAVQGVSDAAIQQCLKDKNGVFTWKDK